MSRSTEQLRKLLGLSKNGEARPTDTDKLLDQSLLNPAAAEKLAKILAASLDDSHLVGIDREAAEKITIPIAVFLERGYSHNSSIELDTRLENMDILSVLVCRSIGLGLAQSINRHCEPEHQDYVLDKFLDALAEAAYLALIEIRHTSIIEDKKGDNTP